MKKIIFFILFLNGLIFFAEAQKTNELFTTKEFRNAVEKKTRTFTGDAGENYFVNKAVYKIKADFFPNERKLSGNEKITYFNNSSDTLKEIYFNIYQDIYKKGNARDWDMGGADVTNGVIFNKIIVAGKEFKISDKNVMRRSSMLKIETQEVLLPKSNIEIEINWEFTLPDTVNIRHGTYENDNFMVAYWFPKIAVYDDIRGWNTEGYTGRAEFYNDNADFDVEIIVDREYNVWANAPQQNYKETFNEEYLKRIEKAENSDETINIITARDRENNDKITRESKKLSWKFKSENTPDFAFAVSKSYLWDATKAFNGKNDVFVSVVYKAKSEGYPEVAKIAKDIVEYFSTKIPAIPYPYPQVTVFNGGGGMEFPGMVNDGEPKKRCDLIYLTAHEVGHSYFPFYTGLNEQKYAWMDEGLISFFPSLVTIALAADEEYKPLERNIKIFNYYSNSGHDTPLSIFSDNTANYSYRFHAYTKPAVAYNMLYEYLGEKKFISALQILTQKWNGKHPLPLDFFNAFNSAAGQDLAWFWEPWFFTLNYADLAVTNVKSNGKNTDIEITNVGKLPLPVLLYITDNDNKTTVIKKAPDIWKNKQRIIISTKITNIKKIELEKITVPDVNHEDNIYLLN